MSRLKSKQKPSEEGVMAEARAHPLGALSDASFLQVCERLNQIIQVG